jgi:hypothetical protein
MLLDGKIPHTESPDLTFNLFFICFTTAKPAVYVIVSCHLSSGVTSSLNYCVFVCVSECIGSWDDSRMCMKVYYRANKKEVLPSSITLKSHVQTRLTYINHVIGVVTIIT